jgi:hypothetical protein
VEVAGVERDVPDGLVDGAKLGDRELRPAERRPERRVLELRAGALDAVRQDLRVVERQSCRTATEQRPDVVPGHPGRVAPGGR